MGGDTYDGSNFTVEKVNLFIFQYLNVTLHLSKGVLALGN